MERQGTPVQVRLEKETNATLKRLLIEMEELGSMDPAVALDPVAYNDRRKRVMRSLWNLVKLAVAAGGEIVTTYECPECGQERRHVTRGA